MPDLLFSLPNLRLESVELRKDVPNWSSFRNLLLGSVKYAYHRTGSGPLAAASESCTV